MRIRIQQLKLMRIRIRNPGLCDLIIFLSLKIDVNVAWNYLLTSQNSSPYLNWTLKEWIGRERQDSIQARIGKKSAIFPDTWTAAHYPDMYIFQCCGSGMFVPDPQSLFFSIPDPGSRIQKQQKQRGAKKFVVLPFFVAPNITKLKIMLLVKYKKKFGPINRVPYTNFSQKFSFTVALKNIGLGSGIRDTGSRKTYSGLGSATLLFSDLKSPAKLVCNWSAAPLMQT